MNRRKNFVKTDLIDTDFHRTGISGHLQDNEEDVSKAKAFVREVLG
jgi:hypothetical protein